MINLSTKIATFLIILLAGSAVLAADLDWPIKEKVDIYHGFGEFRSNRYHAGIDIRTGGKPGRKVYSPVDGYVYRVKMAYNGYGKGLYIMGDDGRIYVYGHLEDFAPRIDSTVKAEQLATKRYFMDKYYPKDSLRIKPGELIALSGQTGAGAPHLHFEVRETEMVPMNPLLAGFRLNDKFAPTLTRLGFEYVDTLSLFEDGYRRRYLDAKKAKHGEYRIDQPLYFNRPFGLLADGFDQSAYNGIKQAVYKYSVTLDGQPYYEVTFDSLSFDRGRTVNFNYDYKEAASGDKRSRRLFKMDDNNFSGAVDHKHDGGIIRFENTKHRVDRHELTIAAEDVYGNKATADFDFIWGPEQIFMVDSISVIATDTNFIYFRSPENIEALALDSIVPLYNYWQEWRRLDKSKVTEAVDGKFKLEVYTGPIESFTIRFDIYTKDGVIYDQPFSGIKPRLLKRPVFDWQPVNGGLSVKVLCRNVMSSQFYLRAFDGDKIVGTYLPSLFTNMREYHFFVPANPKIDHITAFDVSEQPDDPLVGQEREEVDIYLIGNKRKTISSADGLFTLTSGPDNIYRPTFVTVALDTSRFDERSLISNVYRISPEAFLTLGNFDISLGLDTTNRWIDKAGLCWYNESEAEWVWLNSNKAVGETILSQSMGGGLFGVLLDRRKPTANNLSIRRDIPVYDHLPEIRFEIDEPLSGITEDTSIVITVDGDWLIPEYDPETGVCLTKPNRPLDDGEHELAIQLTDRAGNTSKQVVPFTVKQPNKNKR